MGTAERRAREIRKRKRINPMRQKTCSAGPLRRDGARHVPDLALRPAVVSAGASSRHARCAARAPLVEGSGGQQYRVVNEHRQQV